MEKLDPLFNILQNMFCKLFRMISGNFNERLLIVLKDEENDRELRLAVIRYFRKYKYDKAWEYLCCLVEEWRESDWEYAALSALALESYPGKRTIDALKKGCEVETGIFAIIVLSLLEN